MSLVYPRLHVFEQVLLSLFYVAGIVHCSYKKGPSHIMTMQNEIMAQKVLNKILGLVKLNRY